jgi:hypothetical protein
MKAAKDALDQVPNFVIYAASYEGLFALERTLKRTLELGRFRLAAVRRKRTWRASEKAMAAAEIHARITTFEQLAAASRKRTPAPRVMVTRASPLNAHTNREA